MIKGSGKLNKETYELPEPEERYDYLEQRGGER